MPNQKYEWKWICGSIVLVVIATIVILIITWMFDPALQLFSQPRIDVSKSSNYRTTDRYENANIKLPDDIVLSVVIPSYNEELRLPIMLDETMVFLQKWSLSNNQKFEVILVSDGSTDGTHDVAMKYYEQNVDTFRYVKLNTNQGKGAAIKVGVKNALGKYILFADADGATDIRDFDKLFREIQSVEQVNSQLGGVSYGMAVGSRAHLEKKSIAAREWYRTILMRGFHVFVMTMVTQNVRDTQCGFKLFTSAAAKLLFRDLHLYRWAFDIEIIYLAERFNIPIAEVAVNWHEVEGSKLIRNKIDVVTTSLTMARDIICLRACYLLGIWTPPLPVAGLETTGENEL